MRFLLCGISGPAAGLRQVLGDEDTFTIGRGESNHLSIPDDGFLSDIHVAIVQSGGVLRLNDLKSRNGTRVNGIQTRDSVLQEGDQVKIGKNVFLILADKGGLSAYVHVLSSHPEPLFAVLDAAKDEQILEILENSGQPFYSLYFGQSAVDLKAVAPYLVPLAPRGDLLTKIVTQGWSKSWGIFLTCPYPVDEVWKQLRRSLMVSVQGLPEQVYFRFYDPRVFRVFLPMSTPQQRTEFSGPIRRFLVEDEDPSAILQFNIDQAGLLVERFLLENLSDTANNSRNAPIEQASVLHEP